MRAPFPPLVAVGAWLALIGVALALAAGTAVEPPSYDPFSYVVKAKGFWDALGHGQLVNPFSLEPTVRPPGTILVSYPLGFSPTFQWFYFRTVFIPVLLLAGAVYIAGSARDLPPAAHWLLAALALALAGMPTLFQFQQNNILPAASFWGLVDNFIASVAAVAVAAASRSARDLSWRLALAAAVAAALCLMIKPSGLLVMALAGAAWLLLVADRVGWRTALSRTGPTVRGFVQKGLAAVVTVYVLALGMASLSQYFSAGNIAFGSQVLRVMRGVILSSLTLDSVRAMLHISVGDMIPAVIAAGLLAALACGRIGDALAAVLCLAVGGWFWLFTTDVALARYFLPFCAMAYVAVVPALTAAARRVNAPAVYLGAAVAAAPAMAVTALLFLPKPPVEWQRSLGVNLIANHYQEENDQAADLIRRLQAEGADAATVYLFHTTAPLRNFSAFLNYAAFIDPRLPRVIFYLPMDWQHSTTFRFDELIRSEYIAFEPIRDEAARAAILAGRNVPDFGAESRLMNAWFSGLTDADGVSVVSETGVRLLKLFDPSSFEAALTRLEQSYAWTGAFHAANPPRWRSAEDVAALRGGNAPQVIGFRGPAAEGATVWLRDVALVKDGPGLRADFWIEQGGPPLAGLWYLFAHLVDATGRILDNRQTALSSAKSPEPGKMIRRYSVTYEVLAPGAEAVAFGLFRSGPVGTVPRADEFLPADGGTRDWGGRRVILPLP